MPNRDGTGPSGKGPGTGKGMGPCKKGRQKDEYTGQSAIRKNKRRGKGQGKGKGQSNKQGMRN
jgi:hypothetical protein